MTTLTEQRVEQVLLRMEKIFQSHAEMGHGRIGGLHLADIAPRETPQPGFPMLLDYATFSMGSESPTDSTPFKLKLYDARLASRILFVVSSSILFDAGVQLYGAINNSPDADPQQCHIGPEIVMLAGKQISIIPDLESTWHPWFGLHIRALGPPVRGNISASVYAQEWFPPSRYSSQHTHGVRYAR